eukprot:m.19008 g.19008  ORF g.19008 m.19008 type:complete len:334 (+) comp27771_c0_seq5:312-1313(+)
MSAVSSELKALELDFKTRLKGCELITCHPSLVLTSITRSKYRSLRVALQFPPDYPNVPLIVELKSKTVPEKVLDKLTRLCDEEVKRWIHKEQVLSILLFIKAAVDNNPFLACSEEVAYIKNELISKSDDIKIRQKSGKIVVQIKEEKYSFCFQLTIGENYPEDILRVEVTDSNFPRDLIIMFQSQAQEIARKRATPPLRKDPKAAPFQPLPSLREATHFLVKECARPVVSEKCYVCNKKALPEDPKDAITDPSGDLHVERIYCGHFYHYKCLDKYLQTPPFKGGKLCAKAGCGRRIFHDKWKASRDPKLAEDRWAHQEAKKRELNEVIDFLGL